LKEVFENLETQSKLVINYLFSNNDNSDCSKKIEIIKFICLSITGEYEKIHQRLERLLLDGLTRINNQLKINFSI